MKNVLRKTSGLLNVLPISGAVGYNLSSSFIHLSRYFNSDIDSIVNSLTLFEFKPRNIVLTSSKHLSLKL